jgi:hypothetical protein
MSLPLDLGEPYLLAEQRGEPIGVDVPARDRHADATAGRDLHPPGEQRGQRARAARLRDGLQALEQQPHGGHDLVVGHGPRRGTAAR